MALSLILSGCLSPTLKGKNTSSTSTTQSLTNAIVQFAPWPSTFFQFGSANTSWNSAGSDDIRGMTVDANGNTYLVGSAWSNFAEPLGGTEDILVIKIGTTGAVSWIRQLGTTTVGAGAAGSDRAMGVVVNTAGDVFVAGFTNGNLAEVNGGGGQRDVVLVKLNSSGTLQWIRQYGSVTVGAGSASADEANSIAIDSNGDIFIAGRTFGSLLETNGGTNDGFVMKLNPSTGALVWGRQFGSTSIGAASAGNDDLRAITVDSSGAIIVAGETSGGSMGEANGGGTDIVISKLNTNGTIAWIRQYGNVSYPGASAGDDRLFGSKISTDFSGNIYLAGYTNGSLGEATGGGNDVYVTKLNTSGVTQWLSQWGNVTRPVASNNSDMGLGVTFDHSGMLRVLGMTLGALGETNGGSWDMFIGSVNPNTGALNSIIQFGSVTKPGTSNMNDSPASIASDPYGDIYVSGTTTGTLGSANGGTWDIFTAKFPQ